MAEVALATTPATPTRHLGGSRVAVCSRTTGHRTHSDAAAELARRAVAARAAVVIDTTVAVDEAPVVGGAGRRITTMAGHVAWAVRVLEALVVGAHHVAVAMLIAPSVDSGGAVRCLCLGESNRVSLRRRTLPPPRSPPPRGRGAVPEVGRGGQVEEDSGAGGGLAEGLER